MGALVFAKWLLAAVVAVTIYWPLNIPFIALAYRVRHGQGELPLEPAALWGRATFATLGLALLSVVLLGLNYLLVAKAFMPIGAVHLVLLMAYVPAGVGFLFWIFTLDDFFEALSLMLLYIMLPGLLLLFIDRVLRFWQPIQWAATVLSPTLP